MSIGWPEGIWLALVFLGIGDMIARHGEPRKVDAIDGLIGAAVGFALLYWGGFFA